MISFLKMYFFRFIQRNLISLSKSSKFLNKIIKLLFLLITYLMTRVLAILVKDILIIYLRGSLADLERFVVGYSDIDFFIILKETNYQKEKKNVFIIWRLLKLINLFIPLYGDVEIMTLKEIKNWLRKPSYFAIYLKKYHRALVKRTTFHLPKEPFTLDDFNRLSQLLYIYEKYFLKNFYKFPYSDVHLTNYLQRFKDIIVKCDLSYDLFHYINSEMANHSNNNNVINIIKICRKVMSSNNYNFNIHNYTKDTIFELTSFMMYFIRWYCKNYLLKHANNVKLISPNRFTEYTSHLFFRKKYIILSMVHKIQPFLEDIIESNQNVITHIILTPRGCRNFCWKMRIFLRNTIDRHSLVNFLKDVHKKSQFYKKSFEKYFGCFPYPIIMFQEMLCGNIFVEGDFWEYFQLEKSPFLFGSTPIKFSGFNKNEIEFSINHMIDKIPSDLRTRFKYLIKKKIEIHFSQEIIDYITGVIPALILYKKKKIICYSPEEAMFMYKRFFDDRLSLLYNKINEISDLSHIYQILNLFYPCILEELEKLLL